MKTINFAKGFAKKTPKAPAMTEHAGPSTPEVTRQTHVQVKKQRDLRQHLMVFLQQQASTHSDFAHVAALSETECPRWDSL